MELLNEVERQIHISLFKNVHLLATAFHNPKLFDGTRLQEHLSRDMFLKANKLAFEQIVYFLLNIIDPITIKSIPWPLFDKKSESKFRKDVKQILNDLNSKYPDARIPTIQTSHMVTPGGIKVVRILWYLSELAILEYLRKSDEEADDNDCIFLPLTANIEYAPTQLKNLELIVAHERQAVLATYHEMQNKVEVTIVEANNIQSELLPLNEEVELLKQTLNQVEINPEENYTEFVDQMTKNLKELKEYEILLEQNKDVINITVSDVNDSEFTYEPNSLNIPKSIVTKTQNNPKELNIMEFLKLIDDVLQEFILCIKQQPSFDLSELEELSLKIIKDYETYLYKFKSTHLPQLQELNLKLQENIQKYNEEILQKFIAEQDGTNQFKYTPEIQFNLPSTSKQGIPTKFPVTSIRHTSLFDTLTTLKKRNKHLSSEKKSCKVERNLLMTDKCKRNILQSSKSIKTPITEEINPRNDLEKLSPANFEIPHASSTPEPLPSSSNPKFNSGIRQLLKTSNIIQTPLLTEQLPATNSQSNFSKEILDILAMDDELESSQLFFNVLDN